MTSLLFLIIKAEFTEYIFPLLSHPEMKSMHKKGAVSFYFWFIVLPVNIRGGGTLINDN